MMKLMIGLAIVALAAPVSAQSTGDSTTATVEKPKKPAQICRKMSTTGSRMGSKTCHTAAEWKEIEAGTLRDIDHNMDTLKSISTDHG